MKRAALVALSLAASLAGCGGGTGGGGAANHVLSGQIGGTDWSYLDGETNAFFSKDETFWADLYDVPIEDTCFGTSPSAATREIILTIPKTLGHHPLGLDLTQTFYVDDDKGGTNYAATNGFVDVTEVTPTVIRGSASFAYNAANSVSGTFEIAVCP